jgi:Phage portal protein, SPP1 Gp6-like
MTLLEDLLQRLNEPQARYAELDRYYEGRQPLAFLSPEAKVALGNRFGVMASNRADQQGAVANGFKTVEELANPLAVVPVVNLRNTDRIIGDWGSSEIEDLKSLCDALNKSLADMMVTSEYVGRPRRFATGIELSEAPVLDDDGNPVLDGAGQPVMREVNPIPEGHRAMISENDAAKFGQLAAADLAGYEASVRIILGQIQAVSTLPSAYLGVMSDQPQSADALRASESSLVARAEARQATFGRAWEQVARLMVAVRDGRDPNLIDDIRVQWADAATRSVAQEADATVKLYAAGLLPASYALGKLGYSDDEVAKIAAARSAESVVRQGDAA